MADGHGHGGSALKAGDYKLEKFAMYSLVNGSTIDLSNIFRYIEIYEDIFSPYITAKLHIEDASNFPERFPIIGQEKVELSFKSDINSLPLVELMFRVYKLDGQQISETGKTQTYVLHLMSEAGYFNFSEHCGYALNGNTTEMVKTILHKHFPSSVWKDKVEVEDSGDNYSFVLPRSFTPLKAISWLASKAYSKTGSDYSPYLFYETLDGHKFKSISKIIEDGSRSPVKYVYTQANIPLLEGQKENLGFNSILPSRYHKIQQIEEMSRFDSASNIMNGVVSSVLVVHDLMRKEFRKSELFERDVFSTMKKLGTESHFRDTDPESSRVLDKGAAYYYLPTTPYTVHSNYNPVVDNSQVESLFLKRNYHMNSFLTQRIMIQVFGDSRRRVGDIVSISVPKPQSDVMYQYDRDDKNISGEYMITSIKHSISGSYSCKYELSRNCMGV